MAAVVSASQVSSVLFIRRQNVKIKILMMVPRDLSPAALHKCLHLPCILSVIRGESRYSSEGGGEFKRNLMRSSSETVSETVGLCSFGRL